MVLVNCSLCTKSNGSITSETDSTSSGSKKPASAAAEARARFFQSSSADVSSTGVFYTPGVSTSSSGQDFSAARQALETQLKPSQHGTKLVWDSSQHLVTSRVSNDLEDCSIDDRQNSTDNAAAGAKSRPPFPPGPQRSINDAADSGPAFPEAAKPPPSGGRTPKAIPETPTRQQHPSLQKANSVGQQENGGPKKPPPPATLPRQPSRQTSGGEGQLSKPTSPVRVEVEMSEESSKNATTIEAKETTEVIDKGGTKPDSPTGSQSPEVLVYCDEQEDTRL